MDLSSSLDILFMLLAFLAVRHTLPSLEQINNADAPSTPRKLAFDHLTSPKASPSPSKLLQSPASPFGQSATSLLSPVPRRDSLAVPQITLTPDLLRGGGASRPKHGRKSVSFSLSSMDELMAKRENKESKKRPPTPFNRSYLGHGPIEFRDEHEESVPPLPKAVEQMRASRDARDTMGVKKEWLMPRGSV